MGRAVAVVFLILFLPAPESAVARCRCDCDGDGRVQVAELVRAARIAMAFSPRSICEAALDDACQNCPLRVDDLVGCVRNALEGCPDTEECASPSPTPTSAGCFTPKACPTSQHLVSPVDGCSFCATVTPVATSEPTPTQVASPSVTPPGPFYICGRAAMKPGVPGEDGGVAHGVNVRLSTLPARMTMVPEDIRLRATFCFFNVAVGEYTLTADARRSPCNQFGCWDSVVVTVEDAPVLVDIPMVAFTPTPTGPTHTATRTRTRTATRNKTRTRTRTRTSPPTPTPTPCGPFKCTPIRCGSNEIEWPGGRCECSTCVTRIPTKTNTPTRTKTPTVTATVTPTSCAPRACTPTATPLGVRAFSIRRPASQLIASLRGEADVSANPWLNSTLEIEAGSVDANGVAPLRLLGDVFIGGKLEDGSTFCFRLEARSSEGSIDCDGGSGHDVELDLPPFASFGAIRSGLGVDSGPGAITLRVGMNGIGLGTNSELSDCFDVLGGQRNFLPTVLSSATLTASIAEPRPPGPPILFATSGQNFDCDHWTTSNRGALVLGFSGFDPAAGSLISALRLAESRAASATRTPTPRER